MKKVIVRQLPTPENVTNGFNDYPSPVTSPVKRSPIGFKQKGVDSMELVQVAEPITQRVSYSLSKVEESVLRAFAEYVDNRRNKRWEPGTVLVEKMDKIWVKYFDDSI